MTSHFGDLDGFLPGDLVPQGPHIMVGAPTIGPFDAIGDKVGRVGMDRASQRCGMGDEDGGPSLRPID
eukprot:6009676-Heterocapsa_arctica.AAC.1